MSAKTTIDKEARTVTLHFENNSVTMSFTTYRQLEDNGGYEAWENVCARPRWDAARRRVERKKQRESA
jgi:hypothetical protein